MKRITFWLLVILVVAAILRFYRLPEYIQFLGDEGRDALIVKRMIVDHQWTLLGPTASVGGFFIGGLYYYFMLPFLWLWKLDPTGPAVMNVLFGLGTIVLMYFFCRDFFSKRAALIAVFLLAISPKMIYISRFSWNPNPMPFFALLTIYLLYLAATKKKLLLTLLAGISVGIMLQLHYMDLVFIPILSFSILLVFPWPQSIVHLLISGLGVIIGNSMFILFEFRHNFPNTRSVFTFLTRSDQPVAPRNNNLIWVFDDMSRRLYETVLGFANTYSKILYYLSTTAFFAWSIKVFKKERIKVILIFVWLLIGILGVGSYRGQLADHYFGYLFPIPFIFLAILGDFLLSKKLLWLPFVVGLSLLVFLEIKNMYFWYPPNNLVQQTKAINEIVLSLSQVKPYNFALASPGNSDHAYRYFLEIWGRSPVTILNPEVDPARKTVTDQLIVVCEQKCSPLGHPLWEVAGFGRAEIVEEVTGPAGIQIYKLVHYKQ